MQVKKSSSYIVGVARWVLGVALVFVAGSSLADKTYYVRPAESGEDMSSGSGTEDDPYLHPQAAINAADPSELTTILLAEGTYPIWKEGYDAYYDGPTKPPYSEGRVISIAVSNIHIKAWDATKSKPILDAGTTAAACTRAIDIAADLENVKISGLATKGGTSNQNKNLRFDAPRVTCVVACSGTIEDCEFVQYNRYRCPGILLNGPVVLRHCEITDATNATGYNGGATAIMPPLYAREGALVDGCYVHDTKFNGANKIFNLMHAPAIYVEGAGTTVRNTVVKDCSSGVTGGTAGGKGSADKGTGIAVYDGALVENCTVVNCQNVCDACGGIYVSGSGCVRNCIVWGNTCAVDSDTARDILLADGVVSEQVQCCDAGTGVTAGMNGNMVADPEFLEDNVQIGIDSPLAGKGVVDLTWMTGAVDVYGKPRLYAGTVSMGAMEPQGRSITFKVTPYIVGDDHGRVPCEVTFNAEVSGTSGNCSYIWNFGDGIAVTSSTALVSHRYFASGRYVITLMVKDDNGEHIAEKTLSFDAVGEVCYVKADAEGVPPYDTWEKATSNLMAAVRLAPMTVWVSNGVYQVNFASGNDGLRLNGETRLVSVNGANVTIIEGDYGKPIREDDYYARSLVTMTDARSSVEGFTFRKTCPPLIKATAGRFVGNVVCEPYPTKDQNFVDFGGTVGVTNCVFDGAEMYTSGWNYEGAFVRLTGLASMSRSIVRNVTFSDRRANPRVHAGVWVSDLASLRNSFVTGMVLTNDYYSPMNTVENWAVVAQDSATVENCTITASRMKCARGAGLRAEGAAAIRNVVSYNNVVEDNEGVGPADFSCESETVVFENNLIGAGDIPESAVNCIVGKGPRLVDDDAGYRITRESPCFNAGKNLSWCDMRGKAKDIEGQERHRGRPDIGCYEVQLDLGLIILLK